MNKKHEVIKIVPYDPQWVWLFEREAAAISAAVGEHCLAVHHFGSTAVPGLAAKPKIDILVVTKNLANFPTSALERIGFSYRGEVIPTGRYFSKKQPRVHVHVFEQNNPLIERNLAFRDWLRTHAEDREAYARLKTQLATQYTDGMDYCRAKDDFIAQILHKAIEVKR